MPTQEELTPHDHTHHAQARDGVEAVCDDLMLLGMAGTCLTPHSANPQAAPLASSSMLHCTGEQHCSSDVCVA